jgi:3-isopropylmalate/(R)-2-methylmalate dehydratase small subunit
VIAESFAPIFRGNCVRNGVLPIALEGPVPSDYAGAMLTINLARQSIEVAGKQRHFAIDDEAKTMLFEGLDAIALTLKRAADIAAFHARDRLARPWVYL